MQEQIKTHVSLKKLSAMHVGGEARYFAAPQNVEAIQESLAWAREKQMPVFILGGASNVLISDKGLDGLVVCPDIRGREVISDTDSTTTVRFGAGETWDSVVEWAVTNNLYGIENLSRIPGSIGGAPVQNIGAYGQEISSVFESVDVVEIATGESKIFHAGDMNFGYRKSRLNSEDKGKYIVTHVTLKLEKNGTLKTGYGDVDRYFQGKGSPEITLPAMREAIISIRDTKFPFPSSPENGTLGSFFNAPPVSEADFDAMVSALAEYAPDKVEYCKKMKSSFKVEQGYKVPFGILIESLGFKGKVHGGVKILESHAGVINNFSGKGTATEVYELAQEVLGKVKEIYGIQLKIEPELLGEF